MRSTCVANGVHVVAALPVAKVALADAREADLGELGLWEHRRLRAGGGGAVASEGPIGRDEGRDEVLGEVGVTRGGGGAGAATIISSAGFGAGVV